VWLRISGGVFYFDSFRNDVVFRGYTYNKAMLGHADHDWKCDCRGSPVRWRLLCFSKAGGVDALHTLIAQADHQLPTTMARILTFTAMTVPFWNADMERLVIPYMPMATIGAFLIRNHKEPGPTYSWQPLAQSKQVAEDIMRIYGNQGLLYPSDFFTHGLTQFLGRRNACRQAIITFIGIHKHNRGRGRGRMHGIHLLMRQVGRVIWETRRHSAWLSMPYQMQLAKMF
jgi:hypothetical protein